MYRVLAAVDGNEDRVEQQLETLSGLPGREELAVTVLHVHEEIDVPADEAGRSVIESINEDIDSLQGVPDSVFRIAEELEELGIQSDVATMRGDPVPTILDAADDIDADAILVAARNRSPVGKAMFGSVTQGVILDSDVPVIVGN